MKLPRSNVFTFILYQPSKAETSLGILNSYTESSITIQEFQDFDAAVAESWLQEKFTASMRLATNYPWRPVVNCLCLINGIPAFTYHDVNLRVDVQAIVHRAMVSSEKAVAAEEAERLEQVKRDNAAREAGQFSVDVAKIRALAAKHDAGDLRLSGIEVRGA